MGRTNCLSYDLFRILRRPRVWGIRAAAEPRDIEGWITFTAAMCCLPHRACIVFLLTFTQRRRRVMNNQKSSIIRSARPRIGS